MARGETNGIVLTARPQVRVSVRPAPEPLDEVLGDERHTADLLLLRRVQIAVSGHQLGHLHTVGTATDEITAVEDRNAVAHPGDAEPGVRDVAHAGQASVHEQELDGRG